MKMKINTDIVLSNATMLEGLNKNLTEAFSDASNSAGSLNSSWSGQAGESAVALFNSLKSGCIDAQEKAVDDYISFLKHMVVEGYEEVETVNENLSSAFK